VLLGAAFVAIGYLVSAFARDRGTAAGICIGLWLLLVLIYDMALLGVLALDQGRSISATALNAMLLLNPTDAYRLLNLTGFANVSTFAGMAGFYDTAGKRIGTIRRLVIEKVSGHVVYAVTAFGGFLGVGAEIHTIPWQQLRYDTAVGGHRTNITESQLQMVRSRPQPSSMVGKHGALYKLLGTPL
jgi:hypothetical protein